MPKKEFEATKGLLEDDMRRQAGSIEKSWLEAVMNAVDANATEFKAFISEHSTELVDDGDGIAENEVNKYFAKFGYRDDDVEDKTFGRFRRGRGQIMNFGKTVWHTQDNVLVTDLDNDQTTIDTPIAVDPNDGSVIDFKDDSATLDTSGNGFNHQTAQEYNDGTKIFIEHYKPIDDVEEKVSEFKKLAEYISWMHGIDVYINEEKVGEDFNPDFETEYGYFSYESADFFNTAYIYNMGAYVKKEGVKDGNDDRVPLKGTIISKEELKLNNARTEIIEGCDVWEQLREDYITGAKYHLAKCEEISTSEANWLIKQSKDDNDLLEEIKSREMLDDINGNSWSLEDLSNTTVSFADQGDKMAEDAMNRGEAVFLNTSHMGSISEFSSSDKSDTPDKKNYTEVVQESMSFEMQERNRSDLSKRRKKNLRKIEWVLDQIGCYDQVKPGYSKHKDVWKDDEGNLFVDENFINANKLKMATVVIDEVIRVAAADHDTREGIDEGNRYKSRYMKYMKQLTEVRQDLIQGRNDWSTEPELV